MLESQSLQVMVNPQVGGAITSVRHKATGLSILGSVPWESVDAPLPSLAACDESEWLTRYTGGWPLLFPNAGDACTVDGTFHGFHGEASIAPWKVEAQHNALLVLTRTFSSVPVTMRRTILLDGEALKIREEINCGGDKPFDVMWGHHPTFGSDLLAGPVEVTCGATAIQAEAQYDPAACPFAPGARGTWPMLPSKAGGSLDLAHPQAGWATVIYLMGFDEPWAAIRRTDNAIAALLTWDGTRFPCAWLWYELAATQDAPWNGRTRLISIEPNTTPCAMGLGEAIARGAPLLRLEPGSSIDASIVLHVFKPSGPIHKGRGSIPTHQGTQRS